MTNAETMAHCADMQYDCSEDNCETAILCCNRCTAILQCPNVCQEAQGKKKRLQENQNLILLICSLGA